MVAVKAVVILAATMVHAAKNLAAMCALTTEAAMAKAVPRHAAHVQKAVVQPVVVKAPKVVKTAVATMVTNCHATLIR